MKSLIIIVFNLLFLSITLFLPQSLYAASIADFTNIKNIKLDEKYKCKEYEGSLKLKMGFHEVNGNMFVLIDNGDDSYYAHSHSKVYKEKVENTEVTSYVFSWPSNYGLAGAVFTKNFLIPGEKHLYIKYLKNYGTINWVNEHEKIFNNNGNNFDQDLIDFNEKAQKVIFNELEFGNPFKPEDIYAIPDKKLIGGHFLICK